MTDTRAALWALLIVSAPWAVVLVVALLRGYEITVVLRRRRPRAGRAVPRDSGD